MSDIVGHITPKMIDAAVKSASLSAGVENYNGWLALNKLNIFRCEGCGGHPYSQYADVCPDCNGHGWLIREYENV